MRDRAQRRLQIMRGDKSEFFKIGVRPREFQPLLFLLRLDPAARGDVDDAGQDQAVRVTLDRANLRILVEYLDGPFSRLENRWTFRAAGEHACDVEFFISYEFRSRMLALLMGSMFDLAFRRFAAAFEQRADLVYAG